MFRKKQFLLSLALFILLNTALFLFVFGFNNLLPLHTHGYNHAHHYLRDTRVYADRYEFLRSLNVWDAQWYIKIAKVGYPLKEKNFYDGSPMGKLTYAFFPLYPVTLFGFNYLFQNIELTAFILTNLLLLANFFSLYYIVTKLYSEKIAVKAVWLLFIFPFSIFYRSFYTEGIFLLLLIWFSYFLIQKRWLFAAMLAAGLFVTRPNGIVLGSILFYSFYKALGKRKLRPVKALAYIGIALSLFLVWLYFCYVQAGNAFYWVEVQKVWYTSSSIGETFIKNISTYFFFYDLPFHDQRKSQLDTAMMVITLFLIILSKKFLKPQLWWISFFIWLIPLLTRDTMSFARYQIVSFPLFIYLAYILKGVSLWVISVLFLVFLFVAMLYFVNWYWVG
jgi:hypothetical protein